MTPTTGSSLSMSQPGSHRMLLRSILVVFLKLAVLPLDRTESVVLQGRVSFNQCSQGPACPPLQHNTPRDTFMAMRNYLTTKTDFTGQYTCNDLRCLSATVTSMRPNCTSQDGGYFCNIPKEWCVRAVYIALQDQCHVRRCLRCVDLPTLTGCDLCEGIPNLLQINGPSDSVKYRDFWVKIECRDPVRLELHAIAYQCTNLTSLSQNSPQSMQVFR